MKPRALAAEGEIEALARWHANADARVAALEAARENDGGWSPALAVEAALRFLAILDVASLAERESYAATRGIPDSERRTQAFAARSEMLERMKPFVRGAHLACDEAMRLDADAEAQRLHVAFIKRAAVETRVRAAVIAPDAERALRAAASPWDAPEVFPGRVDVLDALRAANTGAARLTWRRDGREIGDDAREIAEHWERLAGGTATATPSRTVRTFAGVVGAVLAQYSDRADAPPPRTSARTAVEHLLQTAVELRDTRHPLAAFAVFVCAAVELPLGAGAIVKVDGDRGTIRRRVAQGLRVLSESLPYEGPRDHLRRAVEALGHRLGDLTGAERVARSRAAKRRKVARR